MDSETFKKKNNVIYIYNENGKNIEKILNDIFTYLITEDIKKEVWIYE